MFYSPTQFVFGRQTESQTGALASEFGAKKAMIVYGGGSVKRSGLLQRVEASLAEAGVAYVELGGVQPNPVDTTVYKGIDMARAESVDFMLAVGGGSVIDTAKAIAAGAVYDGDFWDFFAGQAVVRRALGIGVVLTIPAAGSEGSGNSVITKVDGSRKLSLRTPKALRPLFAIMNPELTYTLPPFQTACGIADMMAHIMERYFTNTTGVETTDRLCEGVLKAIIAEAPKVLATPDDYDSRANIMWCGTIAHNGTCGVGREEDWASHFIEHEISAIYDVTHGAGLTVVMPAWMEYVGGIKPEKVAQLGWRVFDLPKTADIKADARAAVAALRDFFRSISLPVTFDELGIKKPDIDLIVSKLQENKGATVGFYVRLDAAAVRKILESC